MAFQTKTISIKPAKHLWTFFAKPLTELVSKKQGCPHALSSCAMVKMTVELQSFECEMRYLLTKVNVWRYLLMKNSYLLWDFGTPLKKTNAGFFGHFLDLEFWQTKCLAFRDICWRCPAYRDCSQRAFARLKLAILGWFWRILTFSRWPTPSYYRSIVLANLYWSHRGREFVENGRKSADGRTKTMPVHISYSLL